jgi:hypothetical protein
MTIAPDAPAVCRNCGAALAGEHCSRCGQRRAERLRTREILGDVASGLLGVESRLWRTLRGLTVRPGAVAAEYVAGKRASYVSPFRYCMTVFVAYFLVQSAFGYDPIGSLEVNVSFGEGAAESERAAELVLAIRSFLRRNLVYVFLLALPVLGLVLRWLFRTSGRNYAETMAFTYFSCGHAYLISLWLTPLLTRWPGAGHAARLALVLSYLVFGARAFFRGGTAAAVVKVVVGYVAFVLAVVAIAIAIAIPFVLLELFR